jgi:replicative DNA helicase
LDEIGNMSHQAELATVGCMVLYPDLVPDVLALVSPEDFGDPMLSRLAESIKVLHEKGEHIDYVTVWTTTAPYQPRGLDHISATLDRATEAVPTGARAVEYAKLVAAAASRRKVAALSKEMHDEAIGGDLTAAIAKASEGLERVAARRQSAVQLVSDGIGESLASIERGDRPVGVETGIDGVARWLFPELTVLGAHGGQGKSTLALNVLARVGESQRCTYVSTEDGVQTVHDRLLSMLSGVDCERIRFRDVGNEDLRKIGEATARLALSKLAIAHMPGSPWSEIVSVAESEVRSDSKLVVIDHVSQIASDANDEIAHVKKIVSGAAALAQRLQVPILLLHHLRKADRAKGRHTAPTEQDLKFGGSDLARCVWLLHREPEMDGDEELSDCGSRMFLSVPKRNHGQTGRVRLHYKLPKLRLGNYDSRTPIWETANPFQEVDNGC